MVFQPLLEQRRDFVRQAHRDEGDAAGSVLGGGGHNRLYLVISDAGDHGGDIDMHIYACLTQRLHRFQASGRGRCPRFQQTRGLQVQRRD